ncbi:MAG: hypothetical protein E2O85_02905 [Bacteroidetes bacterium]|nr:MAG: hypothetical protein E2O85_02905 [Bacteroidota bacterium]
MIFIYADDLGWRDLSVMGGSFYETSNIDRLAKEDMRSSRAYSNAPNCTPSRASLVTGQYAPRHGVYTVGSSECEQSIERLLRLHDREPGGVKQMLSFPRR